VPSEAALVGAWHAKTSRSTPLFRLSKAFGPAATSRNRLAAQQHAFTAFDERY
jgi:hypothetical protein